MDFLIPSHFGSRHAGEEYDPPRQTDQQKRVLQLLSKQVPPDDDRCDRRARREHKQHSHRIPVERILHRESGNGQRKGFQVHIFYPCFQKKIGIRIELDPFHPFADVHH